MLKDEEFFSPKEIAEKFKVKTRTIYLWIREGKLKAVRLGNLIRVSKSDLEEFIKQSSDK